MSEVVNALTRILASDSSQRSRGEWNSGPELWSRPMSQRERIGAWLADNLPVSTAGRFAREVMGTDGLGATNPYSLAAMTGMADVMDGAERQRAAYGEGYDAIGRNDPGQVVGALGRYIQGTAQTGWGALNATLLGKALKGAGPAAREAQLALAQAREGVEMAAAKHGGLSKAGLPAEAPGRVAQAPLIETELQAGQNGITNVMKDNIWPSEVQYYVDNASRFNKAVGYEDPFLAMRSALTGYGQPIPGVGSRAHIPLPKLVAEAEETRNAIAALPSYMAEYGRAAPATEMLQLHFPWASAKAAPTHASAPAGWPTTLAGASIAPLYLEDVTTRRRENQLARSYSFAEPF